MRDATGGTHIRGEYGDINNTFPSEHVSNPYIKLYPEEEKLKAPGMSYA